MKFPAVPAILILCILLCSCRGSERAQNARDERTRAAARAVAASDAETGTLRRNAVRSYVATMTLQEKVNQLFIVNLPGNEQFVPVETKNGRPLIPGGYLFFSYNIADSPEKIISFTSSIVSCCTARGIVIPFLALDQEGGTVNRLRGVAGPLPSELRVSKNLTPGEAYHLYTLQAQQMRLLGFTLNLAPVAEAQTDENKAFLEGRSFGTAEHVVTYSAAAIHAFQNNGIASVIKHFPGNTNTDPHTGLPEITETAPQMESGIIALFGRLCDYEPAALLMSHARTAAYDPDIPACLSQKWVSSIARNRLGFSGIIMSDDIFMAALAENGWPPEKAVVQAVSAGIDCIMISEKKFGSSAALLMNKAEHDRSFEKLITESCVRIMETKLKYGLISLVPSDTGWRVVITGAPQSSAVERLAQFMRVRDENRAFCQQHFSAEHQEAGSASE